MHALALALAHVHDQGSPCVRADLHSHNIPIRCHTYGFAKKTFALVRVIVCASAPPQYIGELFCNIRFLLLRTSENNFILAFPILHFPRRFNSPFVLRANGTTSAQNAEILGAG